MPKRLTRGGHKARGVVPSAKDTYGGTWNKSLTRRQKREIFGKPQVKTTTCNTCGGTYIVGNFMKHANGVKHQRFLHG
jgi:hypothetical protein